MDIFLFFFQRFLEGSNTWLDLDATLEWYIFSFHSAFSL